MEKIIPGITGGSALVSRSPVGLKAKIPYGRLGTLFGEAENRVGRGDFPSGKGAKFPDQVAPDPLQISWGQFMNDPYRCCEDKNSMISFRI
jgi:hypothetical protein